LEHSSFDIVSTVRCPWAQGPVECFGFRISNFQIVRDEQFAQVPKSKVLKNHPFLEISAQKARIFALPILTLAHLRAQKTC